MTYQVTFLHVENPVTSVDEIQYRDKEGNWTKELEPGGKQEVFVRNSLRGLSLDELFEDDFQMFEFDVLTKPDKDSLVINDVYVKLYPHLQDLQSGKKIVKVSYRNKKWGFRNNSAYSFFKPVLLDVEAVDADEKQSAYIQTFKTKMNSENVETDLYS